MHLSVPLSMLQVYRDQIQNIEVPRPLEDHDPTAMSNDGIVVHCAEAEEGPVKHAPFVQDGQKFDQASEYSSNNYWLERKEWFRQRLDVDFSGGQLINSRGPILFHGTEWGAACRIIWGAQGFIVGPGTHRVRNTSVAGCWLTDELGEAIRRSDPSRYRIHGDFTRMCCPVVLEMQAVDLKKIPGTYGANKYCARGETGTVHKGVMVLAIHFNIRFMRNYIKLEDEKLRQRLRQDPWRCRRCACELCGQVCDPDDPSYWKWEKSGSNQWYIPRCLNLRRSDKREYV